jgi:DNA-binding MarR family transcriptional regulator
MDRRGVAKVILAVSPVFGRALDQALARLPEPVSLSRMRILSRLGQGPSRNSELAEADGVTPASMSQMVDSLVKADWVERRRDPNDRRSVLLTLSPAGVRELRRMEDLIEEAMLDMFSAVDDISLHALARGLQGFARALAGDVPKASGEGDK